MATRPWPSPINGSIRRDFSDNHVFFEEFFN